VKVAKEGFEILHWIEFMGFNNPKLLSGQMSISKDEAEKKLKEFEEQGLIEIEYREGGIYGSRLTVKGKDIWNDDQYMDWKLELGY